MYVSDLIIFLTSCVRTNLYNVHPDLADYDKESNYVTHEAVWSIDVNGVVEGISRHSAHQTKQTRPVI